MFFDDLKVTHTKSPIVQANDYYPFGLTFNSYQREGITPNQYQYNGKELQDELSLGTYDFHARMYDAAVARTFQQDPMSAKYYAFSPYSWAANNPIVFIDPTGMVIEEGSQKEWDKQKGYVEGRRDKLEARKEKLTAKAEKKGWSNEKLGQKMGNVNERISSLNGTLGTMTELENSAQTYSLKPGDTSGAGGITYDAKTGNVVLAYNGTANFVHEVTHGGQFEAGHSAFSSTTGKSYGQDLVDEVGAYKAQFAYSPSSVSGLKSSISARSFNDITTGWVKNIVGSDGSKIYAPGGSANTGQAQIHVNSTRADFMRAYPGMAAKLMGPRTDTMKNFISDIVLAPFEYNGY